MQAIRRSFSRWGNVHIRLGQTEKAIEILSTVTQLQSSHYLAWNNLAAVLAEIEGRELEAMETIENAIEQATYEIPDALGHQGCRVIAPRSGSSSRKSAAT